MKASILARLTFLGIITAAPLAWAEKAAELSTKVAEPGKLILEDRFDGDTLDTTWLANKGAWEIVNGELVGRELATDHHAAVLTLKQPNRDSVLRFSFKLDGAKMFNVSFNHARGHLFRVIVRENGLQINKDKDKRDPKSKVERLAEADGKFEPGKWYTLQVAIRGDQVEARADNGVEALAVDKRLDVEKTGYRFVTRGDVLVLDDVSVWDVKP